MAIHGQIWAPEAALVLGNVTNTTVAQVLGGAVVAKLDVDASQSIAGLVISVEGAPTYDLWELTSLATTDDGASSTRARHRRGSTLVDRCRIPRVGNRSEQLAGLRPHELLALGAPT